MLHPLILRPPFAVLTDVMLNGVLTRGVVVAATAAPRRHLLQVCELRTLVGLVVDWRECEWQWHYSPHPMSLCAQFRSVGCLSFTFSAISATFAWSSESFRCRSSAAL